MIDSEEWLKSTLNYLRDTFLDKGEIRPGACILSTKDPNTGAAFPTPAAMFIAPVFDEFNNETKTMFSQMIRTLSQKSEAIATIFWSEAWMVKADSEEGAAKIRQLTRSDQSLEHVAGRREMVFAVFEKMGKSGTQMWVAEIVREEGAPVRLEEFVLSDGRGTGRFTGFIGNESVN